MANLDLKSLLDVVQSGPCPLFATVGGAHLYGFPSPGSDVDLRGAFVLSVRDLLRLREPVETLTATRTVAGMEVGWVAHDLRRFARMMTQLNGSVLEQLYSPLVVYGGPWLDELRAIGRGCITRNLFYHYRGLATAQRKLLAGPAPAVKEPLYAYRALLTGIHLLQSGELEANLCVLAQGYPLPDCAGLVAYKTAGTEHEALQPGELEVHLAMLSRLENELAAAFEASGLPESPTTLAELDEFVVRARLELAGDRCSPSRPNLSLQALG